MTQTLKPLDHHHQSIWFLQEAKINTASCRLQSSAHPATPDPKRCKHDRPSIAFKSQQDCPFPTGFESITAHPSILRTAVQRGTWCECSCTMSHIKAQNQQIKGPARLSTSTTRPQTLQDTGLQQSNGRRGQVCPSLECRLLRKPLERSRGTLQPRREGGAAFEQVTIGPTVSCRSPQHLICRSSTRLEHQITPVCTEFPFVSLFGTGHLSNGITILKIQPDNLPQVQGGRQKPIIVPNDQHHKPQQISSKSQFSFARLYFTK